MGDKNVTSSGTDTKDDSQKKAVSLEQLLDKLPFFLRFELQNNLRATSANPDQLMKLATAQKTKVPKLSLSTLRTFTEM